MHTSAGWMTQLCSALLHARDAGLSIPDTLAVGVHTWAGLTVGVVCCGLPSLIQSESRCLQMLVPVGGLHTFVCAFLKCTWRLGLAKVGMTTKAEHLKQCISLTVMWMEGCKCLFALVADGHGCAHKHLPCPGNSLLGWTTCRLI